MPIPPCSWTALSPMKVPALADQVLERMDAALGGCAVALSTFQRGPIEQRLTLFVFHEHFHHSVLQDLEV